MINSFMWTSIGPTWSFISSGPGPSPRHAGALPWYRKPFCLQASYPARHRNSRPDAPRVTGNGHPPAGCDCRGSGADKLAMWSPSFAVPVRAPKRWWCRECKAPITDERGLVEMPCGFCLDDKAEAKAGT